MRTTRFALLACLIPAAAALVAFRPAPAAPRDPGSPTVVLVVRHAEKQGGDDPALTEAGERRAAKLAHVAREAGVSAIYATTLRRTRLTGEPLATTLDLEVETLAPEDTPGLAERIRKDHVGETVLVVGHSNTIPEIVRALGGEIAEIGHDDYDDLFVLHLAESTTVTHLQYGSATDQAPADEEGAK